MATLKELREKQAKLVADARAKLEEIKDDTPEARAKEIEVEYDKIMADFDKIEADAKRQEAIDEREALLNAADARRPRGEDRSVAGRGRQDKNATPEQREKAYRDAFRSYLRYGREGLSPEERAALEPAPKPIPRKGARCWNSARKRIAMPSAVICGTVAKVFRLKSGRRLLAAPMRFGRWSGTPRRVSLPARVSARLASAVPWHPPASWPSWSSRSRRGDRCSILG